MEGEKRKETVERVSYRRGRNLILQKAKMDSAEADIWRAICVWYYANTWESGSKGGLDRGSFNDGAWIKAFSEFFVCVLGSRRLVGWRGFETIAGAKFTFRRDVVPRKGSFRRGVEANIRK